MKGSIARGTCNWTVVLAEMQLHLMSTEKPNSTEDRFTFLQLEWLLGSIFGYS